MNRTGRGVQRLVGAAILAALLLVLIPKLASGHAVAASGAAMSAAQSGGGLSCSGLEALWESAGGSPGAAFTAAEIARAESGGRQYATDLNGGRSTDRGYFQINSVHGSLSTYDPIGNAKAAVIISSDGTDWSPWVTFSTGAYRGQC